MSACYMENRGPCFLPSLMTNFSNSNDRVKFVVVTGGVCSSLGKGLTTSATGSLLRSHGYRVCGIKIDPYINVDAGLMSPYEHGEVYVLEDGGEVDLDLGNYERWMSVSLKRDHNITTGKVYQALISRERAGDFLGKTVQLVPHFTNEVVDIIFRLSKKSVSECGKPPEICLIELGGTIGDFESQPFVEALRRLRHSIPPEDFCLLHTTYLPVFGGTQKTKPTQHSCRVLMSLGLQPDLLICRSEKPLLKEVKEKLSNICVVKVVDIIGAPNVDCLYEIPVWFTKEGLIERLLHKFGLKSKGFVCDVPSYETYQNYVKILRGVSDFAARIAFVGKYVAGGEDAYFSVLRCFEHCQIALSVRLDIWYVDSELLSGPDAEEAKEALLKCDGIFVPGGFGVRGVDGKCIAVQLARENNIPYFGVCLGMQVALIEFCRNVIGWKDANSEEFDAASTHQVVRIMDCDRKEMGATMHLGGREIHILEKDSVMSKIYPGADVILERHRHRYEVNATYIHELRAAGLSITGATDPHFGPQCRVEAIENHSLRFFLAVQFHPEFISSPMDPSPPYLAFLAAAAKMEYKWPSLCAPRRVKKRSSQPHSV